MTVSVRLESALDPADELRRLVGAADQDGALVTFVGIVRPQGPDGQAIESLFLEHHPSLTLQSLEAIAADAADRFCASNLHLVHRFGNVPAGSPIVFAGASAPHRRAAFETVDYVMDLLKTDAIFWKQERGPDGVRWIEPSGSDAADRQRWR